MIPYKSLLKNYIKKTPLFYYIVDKYVPKYTFNHYLHCTNNVDKLINNYQYLGYKHVYDENNIKLINYSSKVPIIYIKNDIDNEIKRLGIVINNDFNKKLLEDKNVNCMKNYIETIDGKIRLFYEK